MVAGGLGWRLPGGGGCGDLWFPLIANCAMNGAQNVCGGRGGKQKQIPFGNDRQRGGRWTMLRGGGRGKGVRGVGECGKKDTVGEDVCGRKLRDG